MTEFLQLIQLAAWVFALGFAAAAPIGPVNTLAINRGVGGKWTHTLCTGAGSAAVDLMYFTLTLWGGQRLYAYVSRPGVQAAMAIAGAAVLMPLGAMFLLRMFRFNVRQSARQMRRLRLAPPRHLWTDVATGFALTIINPAAPIYWLSATAPWLAAARASLGPMHSAAVAIPLGIAGAAAGLMTWFCILSVLVRFTPQRLGPKFFRAVNGVCGLMLLAFAIVCLRIVFTHWSW